MPFTPVFNPLSLLILKFHGRSVAVFRDHCTRYDVRRPTIRYPYVRWSHRVAGTEHPSRRKEQLRIPAGRPCRRHRPPIDHPELPRTGSGRTLEGNLVDSQHRRTLRDHRPRIWCVPQYAIE